MAMMPRMECKAEALTRGHSAICCANALALADVIFHDEDKKTAAQGLVGMAVNLAHGRKVARTPVMPHLSRMGTIKEIHHALCAACSLLHEPLPAFTVWGKSLMQLVRKHAPTVSSSTRFISVGRREYYVVYLVPPWLACVVLSYAHRSHKQTAGVIDVAGIAMGNL